MLQSHCTQFLVFAAATIFSATTRAILFQAPGARAEDFQKYVLQRNQQTYTQWVRDDLRKTNEEAHPQVIEFAHQALREGPSKQVLSDWAELRRSIDLNKSDREVLTLLAEKLHQPQELCRYLLLDSKLLNILETPDRVPSCLQKVSSPPQALATQLGVRDLLVVDGIVFTKNQLPQRLMAGVYQWRIVSDQYEDRRFVGTVEEFARQQLPSQSWISGDCKNYKLNHLDITVLLQSQIYFSDTCVNPGIPPERTFSSWASEHKAFLWGVGILAAGVAASQLKDKTLVITKP
jgi:hypothetical protein